MPVIKSAIKKARQGEKHREHNRLIKDALKDTLDDYKKAPSPKLFGKISSQLDKAAKKNIIHKNKAARLKSRLSKLLSKKGSVSPVKNAPSKKSPRKKKQ